MRPRISIYRTPYLDFTNVTVSYDCVNILLSINSHGQPSVLFLYPLSHFMVLSNEIF